MTGAAKVGPVFLRKDMMRRFLGSLAICGLACVVAGSGWSMTKEELLRRRLDKMQQAEPQLREANQNRQAEKAPPRDVAPRSGKENEDTGLPIPDPVRRPEPDPKGNLWDKRQGPADMAAGANAASPQSAASSASQPAPPVKRDPKAAAALAAKAAKAAQKGDHKTALAKLNAAVAADPADPELYNNRGNALLNAGQAAESLKDYDRAIAMKPSDPAFFTNRGLAFERLGNPQRACADYQSACDLGDCTFFKSFKEEGHCR